MGGMVFLGCAMAVVGGVPCITKCDTLSWFDLPNFAPRSGVSASRNRWCLRALLKAGRVGMDDRWFGNEFQIFEATDDLEVAMVVLRGGTHNDWRREECSRRYILWDERCKIWWLLTNWSTLKVTVAILKLILWRTGTGSQCKSERTSVMWQNRGFCATHSSEQEYSGHTEGESDLKWMCQPGESCSNQVESQLLLQQ